MSDLQHTEKWYADRLGVPTASHYQEIMAGPGYAGWKNYKAQLVAERLTGVKQETYTSREMQWGTDNEPLAKLKYSLVTGRIGTDRPFIRHPSLATGCSPDWDFMPTEPGGAEFKCPNTATHLATLHVPKVPRVYKAQVQGQMWNMGWEWNDWVSFDPRLPENAQIVIVREYRDETYLNELEANMAMFLEELDIETEFVRQYGDNPLNVAQEAITT